MLRINKGKISKHPIIFNLIIIVVVAVIGIWIAYLSLAIFTKHYEYNVVPDVEKMKYSDAITMLHNQGFKVEISDSLYRDDIKPGYVVEQNPEATAKVKPGRVVYLIINAVSPKQVFVTDLKGISLRQGKSILESLGFKNISVKYNEGKNKDLIQRVLVNGKPLLGNEKVKINSNILLEVSNGKLDEIIDSLLYTGNYEEELIGVNSDQVIYNESSETNL